MAYTRNRVLSTCLRVGIYQLGPAWAPHHRLSLPSERHVDVAPSLTATSHLLRVLCTVSATNQFLRFVPSVHRPFNPVGLLCRERGSRSFRELVLPPPLRPRPACRGVPNWPAPTLTFIAFSLSGDPGDSPAHLASRQINIILLSISSLRSTCSLLRSPISVADSLLYPLSASPRYSLGTTHRPFLWDSHHSFGTERAVVARHARVLVVVRLGG